MGTTPSAMIDAVAGYLAQTFKSNKSIQDFLSDFTDATVKWIRPIFLKDDETPKEAIAQLQEKPESEGRQDAVKSALKIALEDNPDAMALLRSMFETIQNKAAQGTVVNISNSKNIVTGTITAGGNVTVGDTTTIHQSHTGSGDNVAGNKTVYPPKTE